MSKLWLLCVGLIGSSLAYADSTDQSEMDIQVPSPWDTEVEFGYQAHKGNSDSQSLNSRLGADYVQGRYRASGEWKYYLLYKDGTEDKRQSTYTMQGDYKLSPKTYLYSSFKGVDTKYTAYFKDYTMSGGLGYQLVYTDKTKFEVEVGPGYRYQEPNLDKIKDDDIIFPNIVKEAIFRGNINSSWQVVDNLRLSADVTLVSGRSNTRTDTDISVTNNITEDIALKLTHSRQYHDKVPEGLSKADSMFSVNLLFVF